MKKSKQDMIGNWELNGFDEPESHWELAKANLEGAIRLCQDMIDDNYESSFSHASVILSLYHHGIELFLKYAIAKSGETIPTNHYIRGLLTVYCKKYPHEEFAVDLPFVTQFLGHTSEEIKESLKEEDSNSNRNQTDQMYRYHTDRDGKLWEGANGFIPMSFIEDAKMLLLRFVDVQKLIEDIGIS